VRRVAAVVLAAGASGRLGEPKQLVRIGPETLLERSVRVAREAGCSPVIVVLGFDAEAIGDGCVLKDVDIVVNDKWAEGMGASVRSGVAALRDVEGCVLMTCDMPAVTAAHLRMLMVSDGITASSYAGRRGVPAYFPKSAFQALLELQGEAGAKELLQSAAMIALPGGDFDVDTPEDLARVRELFAGD
jgi:molybdenum cofactor cytidylyltransferase